jgi:hypothetical protein
MEASMDLKRSPRIGLALVFVCLYGSALAGFGFPKAEGLDVHDIVADPLAYTGEITVRGGVMENVDRDTRLFQVVDYREYRSCRTVTCPRKWISVISDRKLPKAWDVVEVSGVIEKSDLGEGGFVLKAREVRVTGSYER